MSVFIVDSYQYIGVLNIYHNKKAFYQFMNVNMPGDGNDKITAKLNLNQNVIRHISIKVKEFDKTPTQLSKDPE